MTHNEPARIGARYAAPETNAEVFARSAQSRKLWRTLWHPKTRIGVEHACINQEVCCYWTYR